MSCFQFKQFEIHQDRCAMKVGTDGVLLGAWASGGKRVLDVGSGTGLVSLMMAQRFSQANVVGIDIDAEACGQAEENVNASPFAERVKIVNASLQAFSAQQGGIFDAIVSNPPFFTDSLKNPDKQRALARHADSLPFVDLLRGVRLLLTEDGLFSLIIPTDAFPFFDAQASLEHFFLIRRCKVKTVVRKQPKRELLTYSKKLSFELLEEEEILTNSDGSRSEWYQTLTQEFYVR